MLHACSDNIQTKRNPDHYKEYCTSEDAANNINSYLFPTHLISFKSFLFSRVLFHPRPLCAPAPFRPVKPLAWSASQLRVLGSGAFFLFFFLDIFASLLLLLYHRNKQTTRYAQRSSREYPCSGFASSSESRKTSSIEC
jgi:hypothetical protein